MEDTKRRRPNDGILSADELLKPSIIIRAHPPNPLSRPFTLLPLMLLPREHLPLSSLDLAAPKGDLPNSRLFQSQIRILELEGRLGSNILIARSPSSNSGSSGGFSSASSIFAIERDEAGLYVLCKLGSWVNIQRLGDFATAVCQQRMPALSKDVTSSEQHTLVTVKANKEQGKKRLAIAELQSIVRRRPASQAPTEASPAPGADSLAQSPIEGPGDATEDMPNNDGADDLPARPSSQTSAHAQAAALEQATMKAPAVPALPTPPASDTTKAAAAPQIEAPEPTGPPTADDIFLNIRHQYWESLYHSMGSLAYFAKGPLSRARAAFHLDCDANLEMDHLIDFLKSLVLTTTVIDKKFRETVPKIANHMQTFGGMSDEEPKKKSKKAKKIRLGSNGLFTDEDAHVRKWWEANKPPPRDDEVFPRSEEVKYVISCLRTRETQMQMILILEIMALEAMRPEGDAIESQLPGMAPDTDVPAIAKKEAPRKRNKHNFPLLIDVHADRLCIWQSTISDEVRALAESQPRPNSDLSYSQINQSLKDFCVDIVVPFFYPRLPLVCDPLNRKLGGPVIATPSGRSKTKPSSSSTKSPSASKSRDKSAVSKLQRPRPGSSLRRTASASDSARSLERVLSNEKLRRSVSRGPNDAIAQMRSATAAPIPGLKREMSEPVTLASVPRRSSTVSLKDKDRLTSTLARSSSDISVGTVARVEEARARKKALVEAQLQEAISALKKPNREMAGKAIVEDSEKRLFGITGAVRKIKKTAKASPGDHRVQVKATPVNNRFRDVYVTTSTESHGLFGGGQPNFGQPQFSSHSQPAHIGHANSFGGFANMDHDNLFAPRSQYQDFVSASPRVAATPSSGPGGRIQATPMRASTTSVPDSAIRIATSALPLTSAATAANTHSTSTTALPSFPEEDEDIVLTSSPVAVRRAPPLSQASSTQVNFSKSFSGPISSFRQVTKTTSTRTTAFAEMDMIPGSSPLQARTQPNFTNINVSSMAGERAGSNIFATPTKARAVFNEEATFANSVMATPPAIRPAPVNTVPVGGNGGGMGNSVQSLYQQMGWDDDLDDLA